MHAHGPSSWFDDGDLERELILSMADWSRKTVLEIGCGDGMLCGKMMKAGAKSVFGIDYSDEAIDKAYLNTVSIWDGPVDEYVSLNFKAVDWRDWTGIYDIVVMQGVLEHFDRPFDDLKAIIDRFSPSLVVTSSPGFLNPRGIVWHTLDMLGAVMSKTDLHYLNPWQFEQFCRESGYRLTMNSCDNGWGRGIKMIQDLFKRIPLALRDGKLPFDLKKFTEFLEWLKAASALMPAADQSGRFSEPDLSGATICYRIDIP